MFSKKHHIKFKIIELNIRNFESHFIIINIFYI